MSVATECLQQSTVAQYCKLPATSHRGRAV